RLPRPPLSPYTTLFRSQSADDGRACLTGALGVEGLPCQIQSSTTKSPVARPHGRTDHETFLESLSGGLSCSNRVAQSRSGSGCRSEEHTSELQSRFDLV